MRPEPTQQAIDLAHKRMREPIPVQPFLDWCERREREIKATLDSNSGLQGDASHDIHPRQRLLAEIGWDDDAGFRRMRRWRNESLSGLVERADVEDALDTAGIPFDLIYPLEAAKTRKLRIRLGENRRMTDDEVIAAHTVYMRGRMTTTTLSELIYERFGYYNAPACAKSLSVAFRGLGLPVRQCAGKTAAGLPCQRRPGDGIDFCPEHAGDLRPSEIGGRRSGMLRSARAYRMPPELLERARVLHLEKGLPLKEVGRVLLPLVPWRSADHLAQRIADVAHAEGWHRAPHRDRLGGGVAEVDQRGMGRAA